MLFAPPGIKKSSAMKDKKATACNDIRNNRSQNRYIRAAYNTKSSPRYCRYRSYLVTQFHTHLRVHLRARSSSKHRGSEYRSSNDHIGLNKHRGLEHRGSNDHIDFNRHRSLEHRGSTITEASTSIVVSPSTEAPRDSTHNPE
jgi:hypothetical protein